jgi:asparagine synthase (glutamine-hydrolysing)
VRPGAEVDRERLAALGAALAHRGPDASGLEIVQNVGLVHRRLAILDPSDAGRAPMADATGRLWLTFNGEVLNHAALRAELPEPAGGWCGGSDTETLVHGLATRGPRFVARCEGFWAWAALDTQCGALELVRDRFGVKPLHVWAGDGELWFASELKGLRAAGVPMRPDAEILRHATATGWANGRRGLVAGVRKVAAGTRLVVDVGTLATREERWFSPAALVDRASTRAAAGRPRAAARAALEAALRTAVRRRLTADVPVGTMCSGGIDSGLVTAYAAREQPGVVAYHAAIADQPEQDERVWAEQVARHLGVELRRIDVTAESWRRDFVRACAHVEAPMLHPSSVAMLQISARAREDGIVVLLSGEGADELFGGYSSLHRPERRDVERRGHRFEAGLRELYRWAGRRGLARAATGHPAGLGPSEHVNAEERAIVTRALAAHDGVLRGAERRLAARLLGDLEAYLPHLLNRQDGAAMAAGVEMREPFLDADLVRFCLNLPVEQRVGPAQKGLLRELALEHLPRAAVERPKRGFGMDAAAYLRGAVRPAALRDGALREALGVGQAEWDAGLAATRDHAPLLLWSAEVVCRALFRGEAVEAIEEAVWGGRGKRVSRAADAAPGRR